MFIEFFQLGASSTRCMIKCVTLIRFIHLHFAIKPLNSFCTIHTRWSIEWAVVCHVFDMTSRVCKCARAVTMFQILHFVLSVFFMGFFIFVFILCSLSFSLFHLHIIRINFVHLFPVAFIGFAFVDQCVKNVKRFHLSKTNVIKIIRPNSRYRIALDNIVIEFRLNLSRIIYLGVFFWHDLIFIIGFFFHIHKAKWDCVHFFSVNTTKKKCLPNGIGFIFCDKRTKVKKTHTKYLQSD